MLDLSDRIDTANLLLAIIGPGVLLVILLPRVQWAALRLSWVDWGVIALAAAFCGWIVIRLLPIYREWRNCKEGMQAEIAVAQKLDRLQLQGFRVFHDIPARDFNLDHVVIGATAVFMVETKSRRKPGTGKESAQVSYDGQCIHFPNWKEMRPLEQARAQARWLKDYLHGELGEDVPVLPVVCLPGWFVTFTKQAHQSDVRVINPGFHSLFSETAGRAPLSDTQRNRIVHALLKQYPETVD